MHLLRYLFISFAVLLINIQSFGQTIEEEIEENTNENIEQEVKVSYPYTVNVIDERDNVPYTITVVDPEIIKQRLATIQNIMPMVYNESVEYWINYFTVRRPNFTKNMMENKTKYFPIFEKILKENNMPDELKYLAILESGLNPKAISRSKAVGLWQFMSFTGKEYGLTINNVIDERMHPEKSTAAACRYLKYLNNRFNDWDLALASYNTGPGNISRAMQKTGYSNYWDLHPYIHKDTRAYVPQFISLIYLLNFGQDHGIFPEHQKERPELEYVFVDGGMDLELFSALNHLSKEDLMDYNPHIKTSILPYSDYGYEIAIPKSSTEYFYTNRLAILDSVKTRYNELKPAKTELLASNSSDGDDGMVSVSKKVKTIHKVKKGEALGKIASKYNVSMNEIKRWNNKSSNKVLVGERLTVYVTKTSKVNSNSVVAQTSSETTKGHTIYHTVQRGDTLWNISQKYDGVSVNDIKKWNNLKDNNVKVGQKIKINS